MLNVYHVLYLFKNIYTTSSYTRNNKCCVPCWRVNYPSCYLVIYILFPLHNILLFYGDITVVLFSVNIAGQKRHLLRKSAREFIICTQKKKTNVCPIVHNFTNFNVCLNQLKWKNATNTLYRVRAHTSPTRWLK